MDKLAQVFQYNGAQVRVIMKDGEPLFRAQDVCAILEIANPRDAIMRLDEDEKDVVLTDTPGGKQGIHHVTESGLYALVLSSRKPEAREFKRWITHEVLPQIRKTGTYSLDRLPTHLETAKALVAALEKQALLEAKIEQDKPKVEFFDELADAQGLHTMNEAAKLLGWGPILLFAHLRKMRILMENPHNVPRQCYIDQGYFEVKERTYEKRGEQHAYCQTYVTPKGLQWLHRVAPTPAKHGWPGHRPGGGGLEERGEMAGGAR